MSWNKLDDGVKEMIFSFDDKFPLPISTLKNTKEFNMNVRRTLMDNNYNFIFPPLSLHHQSMYNDVHDRQNAIDAFLENETANPMSMYCKAYILTSQDRNQRYNSKTQVRTCYDPRQTNMHRLLQNVTVALDGGNPNMMVWVHRTTRKPDGTLGVSRTFRPSHLSRSKSRQKRRRKPNKVGRR